MKTKSIIAFILPVLFWLNVFSQNEANIWYFGQYAGMDFNSGAPVALTNSAMSQHEGCATISNSNGNLLFYTDGMTIWNRNHSIMPNGTGLMGDPSAAQSGIIVPKPGNPDFYYVFTVPAEIVTTGLRYSEVDMTLQGGLGDVTTTKNVFLVEPTEEKVTAVRHANNIDIWVITHLWDSDEFYAYLITAAGIDPSPIISSSGTYHTGPDVHGTMKVSPDGSKLAIILRQSDSFELFDFDNSTGIVSNPVQGAPIYPLAYGIEFSPDGSKLYLGKYGGTKEIYQFEVANPLGSGILIGTVNNNYVGTLQVAPDNKIYVAKQDHPITGGSLYLGVIEFPNLAGLACNYVDEGFYLEGKKSVWGLPTFIQSYFTANITYQNDCFGDVTFFDIKTSDPIQSISWNFGDPASGLNNTSDELQPVHVFTSPGNYFVTASVLLSNSSKDFSIEVIIHDIPQISLGNDTLLCQSTALLLDPGTGYTSYMWQDGSADSTYIALDSGLFSVFVTDAYGCNSSDSINITMLNTIVDLGEDTTICSMDSLLLDAGDGFLNYLWNTGATTQMIWAVTEGWYSTEVESPERCIGVDSTYVVFTSPPEIIKIFFPNAFTPNGDGLNDVFKPVTNSLDCEHYSISIYNRWGAMIYQSNDITVGWDGKYKGEYCQPGAYVYKIAYSQTIPSNTGPEIKMGTVMLVR